MAPEAVTTAAFIRLPSPGILGLRRRFFAPARPKWRIVVVVPIHRSVIEKLKILERIWIVSPAHFEVAAFLQLLPHLADKRAAIVSHQRGVKQAVPSVGSNFLERLRYENLLVLAFVERLKRKR